MNKFGITAYVTIFTLGLSGCAAGPDFHGGDAPKAQAFTSRPLTGQTVSSAAKVGAAQSFVNGGRIPEQWWTLFKSKELDGLIRQALTDSPTLAAAEAVLWEARENVNARTGSENYPQLALGAGTSRQKASPAAAGMPDGKGNIFDLHNAAINVSYAFDIFGGGRREIEALKARVDHERFRLEAAYLTISGNVVTNVIQAAALRALVQATEEIIAAQEKQLALVEKQLALGSVSRAESLSLRAQLEFTRASLPAYQKDLSRTRHQLTTLLGQMPTEAAKLPEFDLYALVLPVDLPVSLPSELVRQRPDIRAAEALLHAASAGIGVAAANLLPQITLNGSYGPQAGEWNELFKPDSLVWNVGAGIVQPLFNGGSLRARRRGAVAVYDQTAANFRATVIRAYQEVADVLRSLEADAAILKAQADAEAAAGDALTLARRQFEVGAINFMLVLNAERQYQQSRISLIQAQAARLSDTAALFQALGGGWWNK
ncbi:MAG: efflux transporter outer membrane subunit [Candidatus Omnitrophica bacterium]|nr:efflux transporter outer membrane subunit [Candidatus Omnitrophota bacterium]